MKIDKMEADIYSNIKDIFHNEGGLRIGEASAVSVRVHTVDPDSPGKVIILPDDAGQIFYQKKNRGEILHIDCFHELGRIDQKLLVNNLLKHLMKTRGNTAFLRWLKDYIDIQTANGGGRLTGTLEYGKKKTLRDAHLNHVHIAMYLVPESYSIILPLIDGLEKEIMKQGFKLKKIERLVIRLPRDNHHDEDKNEVDISDYSSEADSLLKEEDTSGGKTSKTGEKNTENNDDNPGKNQEEKERQEHSSGERSENINGNHGNLRDFNHDFKNESQKLYDIAELRSECADDPGKVNEFMEKLDGGYPTNKLAKHYPKTYNNLIRLKRNNIVKENNEKIYLTDYGRSLLNYLKKHLVEIEKNIKKLARKLPETSGRLPKKVRGNSVGFTRNYFGKGQVIPRKGNEVDGPLAVSETVVKSAISSYNKGESFNINPGDIQVIKPQKYTSLDLCLLIDASGSMAGRRMKEVKILAQQLLVSTRDKVAIVAFQEDRVEIVVPFTRDRIEMRSGLMRLKAAGLTPMAYGLKEGKRYVEEEGGKNSMLLLITDGLPTICEGSADPFGETLKVASELSQSKSKFTCIGLKPNVSFLRKLSEKAEASLYIVDELKKESLLRVINQERQGF